MHFNQHSDLEGKHAFLSASKHHWVNYDDEKLLERFDHHMDAALGTRLHALAHDLIGLGVKLPNTGQTLNMYVNDCIGYRMSTEVVLAYSSNAFGTTDAIWFGPDPVDLERYVLRIFDLKNGRSPTYVHQLQVYAAFFCLEYKVRPAEINFDLRIYQNDDIVFYETDHEEIIFIMDRIKWFDSLIEKAKEV